MDTCVEGGGWRAGIPYLFQLFLNLGFNITLIL